MAYVAQPDAIVLALPRGRVPVGFEVARALGAPLVLILARKLGAPGHEELALGAIAEGDASVLNDDVVGILELSPTMIQVLAAREAGEIERQASAYRGGLPVPNLQGPNADGTRLPQRMHAEYPSSLFRHNDLFEGRYRVGERPIALSDIRVPVFVVATRSDHVAPWRSVYKLMLLEDTEVTFLLTSRGHNAGIISEPGHPRRSYQVDTCGVSDRYVDPETWQAMWATDVSGNIERVALSELFRLRALADDADGSRLAEASRAYVLRDGTQSLLAALNSHWRWSRQGYL